MRILHLSDFHFKPGKKTKARQEKIIEKITDKLRSLPKIDIIIFSGDLVHSGERKGDFLKAKELLLDSLSSKLDVAYDKIFVCPGNHDVNRKEVVESVINFIDDKRTNDDLNTILKKTDYQHSCTPIANFLSFAKDHLLDYKDKSDALYFVYNRKIGGKKVGIISINSAWRAVGKNDNNNLVFPTEKLEEALGYLDEPEFKILILHHPLSDFRNYNASGLEDLFHSYFDLMLSGHIHKGKDSIDVTANAGMIKIGAPATLAGDNDSEIGFGVIDFDFDEFEFSINKFLYDRSNNIIYSVPKGTHQIPTDGIKNEQNVIRRKLKRKYQVESDYAKHLFVSNEGHENVVNFNERCTTPVLKNVSANEVNVDNVSPIEVDWNELNTPSDDFLISGKDKCGKTILLKKIQLDLLKNYPLYQTIPFYFDCKEWNNHDKQLILVDEFYKYYDFNKSTIRDFLKNKQIVLLIDNYHSKSRNFLLNLEEELQGKDNIRIIACSDETVISTLEGARIGERNFSKLYFHRLRKKHIMRLTKKIHNLPSEKEEEIVEKINSIFNRLSIPFDFWTVSLFLWIFKKDLNSNFQNDVELINLYIEKLLEKERLTVEKSSFGFDKYKRYLSHLSHYLLKEHHGSSYSASYGELFAFTEEYLNKNPRYSISAKAVLDYVEDRGILRKKDDNKYTFRLNGIFEYFNAHYMTINQKFLDEIIEDEVFYLSFANEFELYAGFRRDDEVFLNKIYEKTKKIFEPINSFYQKEEMPLDLRLKSKLAELNELRPVIDKITEKLKDGLTYEEQDAFEDELIQEAGLASESQSEVIQKKSQSITTSVESLEKSLSILGGVYRNIDEVNDTRIVYEIFDYVIESACNWGFKVMDDIKTHDIPEILKSSNEQEVKELMRLLTHLIPTLVQVRLNDMIGHRNIERIIHERIQTYNENRKDNQYKLFLLFYLLCDINLSTNKNKLDELISFLKVPILQYSSILKLNYYLGFKTNEDSDLANNFRNKLQKQQLMFDNETNLGNLHKSFSDTEKAKLMKKD